jgi:hypothetical protein
MQQEDFEEIEIDIKAAQELVKKGDALDRLSNNQDFRDIISQGYFQDEAVRLVHLKCAPSMQNPPMQASVLTCIDGIGNLSQYFSKIITQAEMARASILDSQDTLSEMAEEGIL